MVEVGGIVGDYRLEDVLGRGGMGIVYRATQLALGRPVALKLIAPELAADAEYRARFRREAVLAASIDHPHVIPIYQAGDADGVLFIAMQLVDGVDLHSLIAAAGRLDPARATRLICQLAWALDAAHARGLVHRDVKPHNVLVTGPPAREHAYLTDFGIARVRDSGATVPGDPARLIGTLAYLAPEQLHGGSADARSDVYSLGCILYESLTGQRLYGRSDEGAVIAAKVAGPPPSVASLLETDAREIDVILARALERAPDRRYRSAGELSGALLAATSGESGPASRNAAVNQSQATSSPRNLDASRRAPGATTGLGSLPVPATPLIGREGELDELEAMLVPGGERLVTLTGPGGAGKTRLGLEIAAARSTAFADGTWFVPLGPVTRPHAVPGAIARALRLAPRERESPTAALAHAVHARELLLVVDNFEHLLPAASIVAELLTACPRISVLATSRAPLRISGERVHPVAPLGLPPMASERPVDVARSPAVALFVARAQALTPEFALDADNATDVAQICRRLDGLPLAIELAAARTTLLSPAELRARLAGTLELLSTGARDLPARQQTLRATIDWSYGLLGQREAEAFRRLAVFRGGCTVAAAEVVCGVGLDDLAALVDINLLQRWQTRRGEARLSMLETVGDYARELLGQSAEHASIGLLHARYYCELAEASSGALAAPRPAQQQDRLEAEYDNLVAALRWCDEHDEYEVGLRLACSLAPFWRIRGRARDGRDWFSKLLRSADVVAHPLHARARYESGWLSISQGDYERGLPQLNEALALFRRLHDLDGRGRCLAEIAFAYAELGQDARARRLADEALRLARRSGDTRTIASALDAGARASGSAAEAIALAEEALECYRRLGDAFWTAALLNNLGYLALTQGDPEGGLVRLHESANIAKDLHDEAGLATARGNIGVAYVLIGDRARAGRALADAVTVSDELGYRAALSEFLLAIAALAALEGRARDAARLVGVADHFRRSPHSAAETILEARYLRPARAQVGETAWRAVRAQGAAMGEAEAIALACDVAVAAADRGPTADLAAAPGRRR